MLQNRMTWVGIWMLLLFVVAGLYLALLMPEPPYLETAVRQSQTTVTAGYAEGTIYDRNFTPLVNRETAHFAAAPPTPETIAALLPHLEEIEPLLEGIRTGEPFVCRVDTDTIPCDAVTVLDVPLRGDGHLVGQHVLGYTLSHEGVTGLESDFDARLREYEDAARVTYTVDARGHVLAGIPPVVSPIASRNGGVVTTLDADLQALCEAQPIEKGAIVVMDVQTGDVLAMASFPPYNPETLGEALADENAPLINRCLCPYSVGSIFKLMTGAAAYQAGMTHFCSVCKGATSISGQVFHCHDRNGHGLQDMRMAMVHSCNVYFVELSEFLDPLQMRSTVQNFGFGTQFALTKSLVSQSGTLPTPEELRLPAEMANFCFGQGKLTATPLQITQMTCGIAGNGDMPLARIWRGFTTDGSTLTDEPPVRKAKAVSRETAYYLQDLMIAAVNANPATKAAPEDILVAAKTSTAQTGRYAPDGTELCHAWITGYFPIDKPRYAVTVLVEDGGYGNDAAAPVFRDIIEHSALWQ